LLAGPSRAPGVILVVPMMAVEEVVVLEPGLAVAAVEEGGGNHIIEPTGNLFFRISVLSIPGLSLSKCMPLTVNLTYNSNAAAEDGSLVMAGA